VCIKSFTASEYDVLKADILSYSFYKTKSQYSSALSLAKTNFPAFVVKSLKLILPFDYEIIESTSFISMPEVKLDKVLLLSDHPLAKSSIIESTDRPILSTKLYDIISNNGSNLSSSVFSVSLILSFILLILSFVFRPF